MSSSSLPPVDHTLAIAAATAAAGATTPTAAAAASSSGSHHSHTRSADLRLNTAQAVAQLNTSPLREPVSPLQEDELATLADPKLSVSANDHAATQVEPVSPLTMSRRPSAVDISEKMEAKTGQPHIPPHPQPNKDAALADLGRTTPVESPATPRTASSTPVSFAASVRSVHPSPAYVADSGAVHVVHEHQAAKRQASGSESDLQPDLTFSPGALALVNGFLDYILYQCLAHARSTSLAALRPAVSDVLKSKLAREAIASAEEELQELLAGNEEEDDVNEVQDAADNRGQWDLDTVWKRTRLRVMVYIRLGEMEDEDEERYVNEDDLFHVSDRRFSRSTGLVSWAAAIFLTAILEYLAEQALQLSGQAALARVPKPSNEPHQIIVEEYDVEKIAASSYFGRLWRVWKKTQRSGGSSMSSIKYASSRSGAMSPSSVAGSVAGSRLRSLSVATTTNEDKQPVETNEIEEVDPAGIPLPMLDVQRDIDEIEVPGLASDPDAIVEPDVVPAIRRQSFGIPPSLTLATKDEPTDHDNTATKPPLVRQRSMSVPTPMRSVLRDGVVPGAFPVDDEEIAPGDAADETVKAQQGSAEEESPNAQRSIEEAQEEVSTASPVEGVVQEPESGQVLSTPIPVSDEAAPAEIVRKDTSSTAVIPAQEHGVVAFTERSDPASKDGSEDTVANEIRQSPKTLGRFDKASQGSIAGIAAAGATAAALTAAVASSKSKDSTVNSSLVAQAPSRDVDELDRVKSLAGIKGPAPVKTEPNQSPQSTVAARIPTENIKKEDVAKAVSPTSEPYSTVPRPIERQPIEAAASKKSTIPDFPIPHSRSGSEYSQVSVPRESLTQPRSQPDFVHVEEDKASETKIDSAYSAISAADARDVIATVPARNPARDIAAAPAPDVPRSHLKPQKSNEKLRSNGIVTNVRTPVTDDEESWPTPPPAPTNGPVKTTVKILPPQIQTQPKPPSQVQNQFRASSQIQSQDRQQTAGNSWARQKSASPYSVPSVSRIPETEVPRDSYFQSQPQSPTKAETPQSAALTSAAIRGPEDFDDFVQNSETVKYTLTPDTIRDDLQKDRMFLRKTSIDQTEYRAKVNGSAKSVSPPIPQEAKMSRSSVSKSTTPVASPVEESPRSPRSLWPLNKDKRRSVSRPEPRNTNSHRKSGLMAREPRVQTDSLRDFADFIRSTGPRAAPPVAVPTGSSQATRSTTSLQSYRNSSVSGLKSASRDSLPPLPNQATTRVKNALQPRSPTVVADANSDLIDFIRSGPAQPGEHRISRTVAPFRSTMDSDDFTEWTDKINTTPPVGMGRTDKNGYAQPSARTAAPAVKSVFKNDSGRTQYRNKDPYAIDWSDDEDDRETLISSLPKSQQEALSRILNGSTPMATTPVTASRPTTNGSMGAPPVRTMSNSSRFSSYRNRMHAENSAHSRDLISFLNAGPHPGVDDSIKTKPSLPSVREDYNSRPASKQSKTKRSFFGFGRR